MKGLFGVRGSVKSPFFYLRDGMKTEKKTWACLRENGKSGNLVWLREKREKAVDRGGVVESHNA